MLFLQVNFIICSSSNRSAPGWACRFVATSPPAEKRCFQGTKEAWQGRELSAIRQRVGYSTPLSCKVHQSECCWSQSMMWAHTCHHLTISVSFITLAGNSLKYWCISNCHPSCSDWPESRARWWWSNSDRIDTSELGCATLLVDVADAVGDATGWAFQYHSISYCERVRAGTGMEVLTYCSLKYLLCLILPVLCLLISLLTLCFLFLCTSPCQFDVIKLEVWM